MPLCVWSSLAKWPETFALYYGKKSKETWVFMNAWCLLLDSQKSSDIGGIRKWEENKNLPMTMPFLVSIWSLCVHLVKLKAKPYHCFILLGFLATNKTETVHHIALKIIAIYNISFSFVCVPFSISIRMGINAFALFCFVFVFFFCFFYFVSGIFVMCIVLRNPIKISHWINIISIIKFMIL